MTRTAPVLELQQATGHGDRLAEEAGGRWMLGAGSRWWREAKTSRRWRRHRLLCITPSPAEWNSPIKVILNRSHACKDRCIYNITGEELRKTVDTIGNCQRPVFSLGVSQNMQKITNLWKLELNWSSKLRDNNERKNTLVTQSCVLADAWFRDLKF